MKIRVPIKWWCCEYGWHGWHQAEIEVEVMKLSGGLIDISLNGIGEVKCDTLIEFDAKKKSVRSWEN